MNRRHYIKQQSKSLGDYDDLAEEEEDDDFYYDDEDDENEEVDFDRPSFERTEIWTDYAEDLDYDQ
ncbi:MAG: hypothetical protein GX801_07675 [Fibrobacter sp.]|nr:hypothetical protein [Fibrobacter sp.]